MSTDYSWIKKGVKAELFGLTVYSEFNGEIVTVLSGPEKIENSEREWIGVEIEEGKDIAKKVSIDAERVCPKPENLKPFNPPNWEGIADGSVECEDYCSDTTDECFEHNIIEAFKNEPR